METKGSVHLPNVDEEIDPLRQFSKRVLIAVGVLLATGLIVWLDRDGYTDSIDGNVSLLDAFYYTTVTLSTTGYGDIAPITDESRLINIVLITPMRVAFLIILIGTTLETLTARSREQVRLNRWRKKLREHTVVIGYGVKGRSAVATLLANSVPIESVVVVDPDPAAITEANDAGLVAVLGDATRADVLRRAGVPAARSVIITTARDDSSVLATLTCRQLNPEAEIIVSVREADNVNLVRQGGANEVVTSSDAVGRILGLATVSPALGHVLEDLTTSGKGLEVSEREVLPREEGKQPRQLNDLVVAVIRDGAELPFHSPAIGHLVRGDRLIVVRASASFPWARRTEQGSGGGDGDTEPEDPADRPPGGV
ncbi:voltage-gated potassium channel [Haloactinopolyspora alba]|uniref:Voltage-gated potassium channel n=1 Tax=Haloactinopolyspora alba TaxID=648780 RepID=A0A2P8E6U9_9ACTN|nr:NAD-binding protein [Haloactinopolyspora alba]PSL05210.1 voltage-gated potassium channel [Haloactinopolyspora alba]